MVDEDYRAALRREFRSAIAAGDGRQRTGDDIATASAGRNTGERPAHGNRWGGIRIMGGGGEEEKLPTNYLVALKTSLAGGEGGAGVEERWSLKPDAAGFQSQSKADQEWLRSVFMASAPVYDGGVLY